MAKLLKLRRGTTTQHASFTGAEGEVTIDVDKDVPVVHDGSTQGGHPVAAEDMANVSSASIAGRLANDSIATSKIGAGALPSDVTVTNANVVSNAAIAGTKVSPDFGSQQITSTGSAYVGSVTVTAQLPSINLVDNDDNPDFRLRNHNGDFKIIDTTNSADRLVVNSDGHLDIAGNTDFGAGIDVTGNITVSGTVDGRDVAADGTKLDGIETAATADQTAAEIRTLVENASDSNVFTDADHTKLNGIEASATADQTNSEIAAALSDQKPSMKGAEFTDDGASSPIVNIKTDDGGPWGLRLGNDNYSSNNGHGLMCYQDNNGSLTFFLNGNSSYEAWSFQQGNGQSGQTKTAISFDANRAVNLNHNGSLRLNTASGGVGVTGDLTASGNVTAYSDAKLKTDISTINDSLGIVGKLRGVNYKWISDGQEDIGVIAQEVEKVVPEVVKETDDGTKSVDYGRLVCVLINAINELKAELDEHKKGGK
tara:strand:- start:3866 stop:5311 length:1446 start_codon:yes stop_codon:yes gene_type:complete